MEFVRVKLSFYNGNVNLHMGFHVLNFLSTMETIFYGVSRVNPLPCRMGSNVNLGSLWDGVINQNVLELSFLNMLAHVRISNVKTHLHVTFDKDLLQMT